MSRLTMIVLSVNVDVDALRCWKCWSLFDAMPLSLGLWVGDVAVDDYLCLSGCDCRCAF